MPTVGPSKTEKVKKLLKERKFDEIEQKYGAKTLQKGIQYAKKKQLIDDDTFHKVGFDALQSKGCSKVFNMEPLTSMGIFVAICGLLKILIGPEAVRCSFCVVKLGKTDEGCF